MPQRQVLGQLGRQGGGGMQVPALSWQKPLTQAPLHALLAVQALRWHFGLAASWQTKFGGQLGSSPSFLHTSATHFPVGAQNWPVAHSALLSQPGWHADSPPQAQVTFLQTSLTPPLAQSLSAVQPSSTCLQMPQPGDWPGAMQDGNLQAVSAEHGPP